MRPEDIVIDPTRQAWFDRMPLAGPFTCDCEHVAALRDGGAGGDEEWPWTVDNKPRGYELYKLLGSPKTIVAPMVEQSELAFRLLCKRYGADLTYSPMVNSSIFTKDEVAPYRMREYSTCPADTNMIVQFCGHHDETLVKAAKIVEKSGCKAIDLNLGCPQGIARKGFYGAFLMDDLPLVRQLITALDRSVSIPITAKIRVFPDPMHTVAYARMLVDAGAAMLGVHGRLREAKGAAPGEASWEQIAMVREALPDVPVFGNGNVWHHADLGGMLEQTHCDAIMSADSLLWEPRLFSNPPRFLVSGRHFAVQDAHARIEAIRTAQEYLGICRGHFTQPSQMKNHLFKITHHSLQIHTHVRRQISETALPGREQVLACFEGYMDDLLKIESDALLAAELPLKPAPLTHEEYAGTILQLGNVEIPPRCALSHLTAVPDLQSEYRRRKDERMEAMLDEDAACYALFD